MLIEKDEILLKNKKTPDILNSYFDPVTDSLIYLLGPLQLIVRILMMLLGKRLTEVGGNKF